MRKLSLLVLALAIAVFAFPAGASALQFEIANDSGKAEEIFVTVAGEAATYEVPGMENNVPKKLSEVPNPLTINQLRSGRIYIAYGAGVDEGTPFTSETRFDWAELTVKPNSADVANLTAVDQFAIGMRLDTFNEAGEHLQTVGDANSDTVFNALQQIPGGPQSTIRNAKGEIIRVLSPVHSTAYPGLGEYVRSMAGKTITLRTAFFGTPFTTTTYSGTFGPEGSITLTGSTDPASATPSTITLSAAELIADINTGAGTPNTIEGAIRRDLLAGFSVGLWGGKYGNDALSFCTNPTTGADGQPYCPEGFNQPAFGDARSGPEPYATCEQYAAVINQYTDVYGNPYSDAAKKVTVSLDQPTDGGDVSKLRLTVLPDVGSEAPATSGNPNCGATPLGPPTPVATVAPQPKPAVTLHLLKKAKVRGTKAKIGAVACATACGQVRTIAKDGKVVVARGKAKLKKTRGPLILTLTRRGKALLARSASLKAEVIVSAHGGSAHGSLELIRGSRGGHGHHGRKH